MNSISHPVKQNIAFDFEGVCFSYGSVKVLDNASFHIHNGEFIALVGPNGSGKTTVLKLLLGLEQPQAGVIRILEESSGRGGLGYVPQQVPVDRAFPITVREVVRLGRMSPYSRRYSAEDKAAVDDALRQTGMEEFGERQFAALSGGQRRRVLVARALAAKPEALILDEPTANMDTESEERLFDTLGRLKGSVTILVVTHDMDFVSVLTDRVLCMGNRESEYGIVQHPTENIGDAIRVVHSEVFPGSHCFDDEAEE